MSPFLGKPGIFMMTCFMNGFIQIYSALRASYELKLCLRLPQLEPTTPRATDHSHPGALGPRGLPDSWNLASRTSTGQLDQTRNRWLHNSSTRALIYVRPMYVAILCPMNQTLETTYVQLCKTQRVPPRPTHSCRERPSSHKTRQRPLPISEPIRTLARPRPPRPLSSRTRGTTARAIMPACYAAIHANQPP